MWPRLCYANKVKFPHFASMQIEKNIILPSHIAWQKSKSIHWPFRLVWPTIVQCKHNLLFNYTAAAREFCHFRKWTVSHFRSFVTEFPLKAATMRLVPVILMCISSIFCLSVNRSQGDSFATALRIFLAKFGKSGRLNIITCIDKRTVAFCQLCWRWQIYN